MARVCRDATTVSECDPGAPPPDALTERSARDRPTPADSARLTQLEALYDAHHRRALGLAYHLLGNMADAEEVVQDVFLAAWRAGDTYDATRGTTQVWLLAMVRHRAIDVLRARARRPAQPLDSAPEPLDHLDVPEVAATRVDAATVQEAMGGLPAEQREAVELAYLGGLSHGEIAARLTVPVGAVKSRLRLGLERLRGTLGLSHA